MPGFSRMTASLALGGLLAAACTPAPDGADTAGAPPAGTDTPRAVLVPDTGAYTRSISTESDLAQQFFDQGLRLTWGYYFPEAVASHQEALRHDPDHPMIHWGLALALGPNPNSRRGGLPDDPQGEAGRAIQQALAHIDHASERERAFIEALALRFDTESYPDRSARDQAYLAAARRLFEQYPDDPDAGGLLADAFMVTTPWEYWDEDGAPRPGTGEAAAALEHVMANRPDHPGANHLYIHLLEASNQPERALAAADRLAPLMPNAGHVVHMPSHIYVRVGQYAQAVESNERSAAADVAFLDIWGERPFPQTGTYFLSAENHRRHAYDFIRYSASVQGHYASALAAARDAAMHEPEGRVRQGPGQRTIASAWVVHKMFGRWSELLAEARLMEGTPYIDGMWHYTRGSAHAGLGDLAAARDALQSLREIAEAPNTATMRLNANGVPAILRLAVHGLDGEIRQAGGDLDGAVAAFEAAVAIEDSLAYTEPPDWAQPMRHYLGAALLEAGRAAEAERVYREDLAWNQNNGWALFGLWQSLEAQGRAAEAETAAADFAQAWRSADVELERSRF